MRRITTIAVALTLLAAACGDDGGGGQAQTEEGAAEAVETASKGALTGNAGAVLNFLSEECRAVIDEDDVRLAVGLAPAFFDDLFDDFDLSDVDVMATVVEFEDDTAEVELTYTAPDGADIDTIGLSAETFTVMYENGKWVDSGCEFEDTSERDAEILQQGLDELGYAATREDPIPRSVAAPVGGGFVVSVDALDPDAAAALETSGGFVSEPEPGEQFVLVSLTVGFDGEEEPQTLSNLNAQIIGGTSGVGVDNFGCGSFPTQLSSRQIKLFTGGVVTGDMCFAVPSDDIAGMQLSVEGSFGTDRTVVFDPTVEASTPVPVVGTSGPAPDGEYTADRQSPSPLGEPVDVGEGWTITIRGAELDATETLLAAGEFNDPPPAGFVYTLVDMELMYNGSDESGSGFSVNVDVVGDSNVTGDSNCGIFDIPDEIDRFADVFQGGSLAGNRCYLVDETDLDSLVVFTSADFFSDDASVLAVR